MTWNRPLRVDTAMAIDRYPLGRFWIHDVMAAWITWTIPLVWIILTIRMSVTNPAVVDTSVGTSKLILTAFHCSWRCYLDSWFNYGILSIVSIVYLLKLYLQFVCQPNTVTTYNDNCIMYYTWIRCHLLSSHLLHNSWAAQHNHQEFPYFHSESNVRGILDFHWVQLSVLPFSHFSCRLDARLYF